MLNDLDPDELAQLKFTVDKLFGFNISQGYTGLVDSFYGGDATQLAADLQVAEGASSGNLPVLAFNLNTNIGSTFPDSDPDRPGFQVNVTLNSFCDVTLLWLEEASTLTGEGLKD